MCETMHIIHQPCFPAKCPLNQWFASLFVSSTPNLIHIKPGTAVWYNLVSLDPHLRRFCWIPVWLSQNYIAIYIVFGDNRWESETYYQNIHSYNIQYFLIVLTFGKGNREIKLFPAFSWGPPWTPSKTPDLTLRTTALNNRGLIYVLIWNMLHHILMHNKPDLPSNCVSCNKRKEKEKKLV